jgi:alpha-beta hydrolase superfamily lysophospholipase
MSRLQQVLDAHRQAGRCFDAAGVRSFVREQGTGPTVLCLHGMIGSSFLYRKVLAELAARGLRGVAFDLPGFGLAERPSGYDYSDRQRGHGPADPHHQHAVRAAAAAEDHHDRIRLRRDH